MDIDKMTPAGKMNVQKVMAGQDTYAEFQKMAEEPMRCNEELLMKILQDSKDTEYGKKYG